MAAHDNWRLTGQEKYLAGAKLRRSTWTPPAGDAAWDHDHCEFCWAKFGPDDVPGVQQDGYTTADRRHWMCLGCYEDFKDKFRWATADE